MSYRCDDCHDTGVKLTPYSEQIYCSCPIGKAFCMCWETTGTPEDKEGVIEAMRLFLLRSPVVAQATPPLPPGSLVICDRHNIGPTLLHHSVGCLETRGP